MDLSFNSSHKVFPLSKLLYISSTQYFTQKNQSRKLFGLLEVGYMTLSIKFIAQEGSGHLGMACLRKAKMTAFSPPNPNYFPNSNRTLHHHSTTEAKRNSTSCLDWYFFNSTVPSPIMKASWCPIRRFSVWVRRSHIPWSFSLYSCWRSATIYRGTKPKRLQWWSYTHDCASSLSEYILQVSSKRSFEYAVNMVAVGYQLSKVTQKVRACPIYKEREHVWMKLLSRILAMHMCKRWNFWPTGRNIPFS